MTEESEGLRRLKVCKRYAAKHLVALELRRTSMPHNMFDSNAYFVSFNKIRDTALECTRY